MTREEAQALFEGATPGPWVVPDQTWRRSLTVEANPQDGGISCPGSGGAMSYTHDICTLAWQGTDEWSANARLIAAAPDLARAYIAKCDEVDDLRNTVIRHIPMNYLIPHDAPSASGPTEALDIDAAMRDYAESRWDQERDRRALGDEVERLREALTLIERIYFIEGKDAAWRAAQMNGVAYEAQSESPNLAHFRRLFNRAALQEGQP